jgi:hypothetical protein
VGSKDEGLSRTDLDAELAAAFAKALMPVESDAARENRETAELIESCRDPKLVWRMVDSPSRQRRRILAQNPWIAETFGRRLGASPIVRTYHPTPARAPRRTCARSRARRAAHRGTTRAGPGGEDDSDPDQEDLVGPQPHLQIGGVA